MPSAPTYLIHTQYGYYFRLRIPIDLKDSFGKSELRYSLRTNALSDAKAKARLLAGRVQSLFRNVRRNTMSISQNDINRMVQRYVQEGLNEDDTFRIYEGPYSKDFLEEDTSNIEHAQEKLKAALAHSDHVETVGKRVVKLLINQGVKVDRKSNEFKLLCWEILKADIQILETLKKRNKGDVINEPLPMTSVIDTTPQKPSETLKEVIEAYLSEKKNKVHIRSYEKAIGYLNTFTFFSGEEKPIAEIDHKHMREYKEFLKKFPTGFFKTKKYKGWTAKDILKNKDESIETISEKTLNHYLGELITFFGWAMRHGYMEKNYAEGLKVPLSKAPHEQRDVFTTEDLNKLFNSKEYKKGHKYDYQYWLPILALFTGARLEELCQLHLNDIKEVEGLWCLDITPEGGTEANPKRLKNKASDRLVPLHPFIINDLKFTEYVDYVKSLGEVRLFPEITWSDTESRWGAIPSKWLRRYKKNCGIEAPPRQKDWHAFRHTVVDNLAQQLIPEPVIKSLVGHSKEGETLGRYAKSLNVKKVYEEAVLKLNFEGLELDGLKN